MKHPKITSLLCALALCVMLISCSSGDKSALPIPIDAGVVLNVDLESLSKKMSWNDIRSSEWFKSKMNSSSDSFMRKVMENPESTGIDLKDDVAFFTKQINSTESYFGLTGHLKDASAFEEFVTKASETNAKPTKEGDINYLTLPNEGIVSWNNNKFLVVGAQSSRISYMMDDSTAVPNAGSTDPKAYAKRLLTTKGDSLIGSDARYTNMLKDEADAHIWSNAEASTGAVLGSGMLSMLKLEKYLEGTVSTSTVNFENGKIVMNAKTYTNDEMMAIFKKYAGNKINTSMVERLPSTDVAAVLVANYKPDMLKDLLKLGGLDGLVNGYLGEMGLTLDEVLSASKGDMMFAVTDFKIQVRTNMDDEMKPVATQTPSTNFIFATTVGNKPAFDKLINLGKQMGSSMQMDTSFSYNMNNDLFVFGNNKPAVDQYLQGGTRNMPFLSKISDHPFGAYIDLQKVLAAFSSLPKTDSAGQAAYDATVKMWQDVVITGGEIKDGAIVQTIEVNLVDKNTNSLKQLRSYMESLDRKRGF